MDENLDSDMCIKIREACSCVMSNEKSIYAKEFRKLRKLYADDNVYMDEVIKYLNGTKPLRRCGEVSRQGDKIFSNISHLNCGCTAIRDGLEKPISQTWCHCCKGSLLSVYKYVFDNKDCNMEISQTVASGGEDCIFITRYTERK